MMYISLDYYILVVQDMDYFVEVHEYVQFVIKNVIYNNATIHSHDLKFKPL